MEYFKELLKKISTSFEKTKTVKEGNSCMRVKALNPLILALNNSTNKLQNITRIYLLKFQ